MFWNRARNKPLSGAPRPAFSITHRLTVTYTLITFALLVVTMSALYYALLKSLEEEDSIFLTEKVTRVRQQLSGGDVDWRLVDQEIQKGSELPFVKYSLRVLDGSGRTRAGTTPPDQELLEDLFAGELHSADPASDPKRKTRLGRHAYLTLASKAGPENEYLIQAALDVTREAGIVQRYRFMAEGILVLAVLVSAAAGALLARRAMRPLARITSVIQRITASQMHARVQPETWPRELTMLATAFDDMLDRLQDSFSRLSHYSADLAHELRTPINNLIGEAEVTLAKQRTPLLYQQNIESNLEEFMRLRNIIDSLLFLAKAESTDIRLELKQLDGAAEARAVSGYFDELFQEKNISFSLKGGGPLIADQPLFRRALSNVLSNALRYTPAGGSIDIVISRDAGGNTAIGIADSGIGIPAQDIPKIFNRFFRAESARTLDATGSGLGLAIVKSILDLHGGTVDIQSAAGRGTTVTLRFKAQ